MNTGQQILQLAVRQQREYIEEQLTAVACPTDLEINLAGVPGRATAQLQAARRTDGKVRAIIVGLDGRPLDSNEWVIVDMINMPEAKSKWRKLPASATTMAEAQTVDAAGNDVVAQVDVRRHNWELTCDCGRKRYAGKHNLTRVTACRICAATQRREKKNKWQRTKRATSSSSQQTTTPTTTDEHGSSAPE